MILVDTNVVSELMGSRPDAAVGSWAAAHETELALSVVTAAELAYGIARLPTGRRSQGLTDALGHFLSGLRHPSISFAEAEVAAYAAVRSLRDRQGRPIHHADAQIAATCLAHRAALATRNTRDFEGLGLTLVDPWVDDG